MPSKLSYRKAYLKHVVFPYKPSEAHIYGWGIRKDLSFAMEELKKNGIMALDNVREIIAPDETPESWEKQYDCYLQLLYSQRKKSPDLSRAKVDYWGSVQQLRFGKIVIDKLAPCRGIHPIFGALLCPCGGIIGPDNFEIVRSYDADAPIAMHAICHDAYGYLRNHHGVGPGYNYLHSPWEIVPTTCFMSGQCSGIGFWR